MTLTEDEIERLTHQLVHALVPLLAAHEKRLIGRDEVAKRLGISVPFVDRLVASGKIPSIELGQRRLFEFDRVVEVLR